MILDKEALFSEQQAITGSAPSTNIVDILKAREIGTGRTIPLTVQVTEDFNNLTSLKVEVQTDDDSGFPSPKTMLESTALLAELKKGFIFPIGNIPRGTRERYLRLNYTVSGAAPTTGKLVAGVGDADGL